MIAHNAEIQKRGGSDVPIKSLTLIESRIRSQSPFSRDHFRVESLESMTSQNGGIRGGYKCKVGFDNNF